MNQKHIARQEDDIQEKSIQILSTDPLVPFEGQLWFNTQEHKLKQYKNLSVIVLLSGSFGNALELPLSDILDARLSRFYYKAIQEDFFLQGVANAEEGEEILLLIDNQTVAVSQEIDVTTPSADLIADGDYFTLFTKNDETKYYVWFDHNGMNASDPALIDSIGISVEINPGLTEISKVTLPTNVNDVFNGSYFLVSSAKDINQYYVWFNIDGLGVDPAIIDRTGIMVAVLGTDTREIFAQKASDEIDLIVDFNCSVDNPGSFIIENIEVGATVNTTNGNIDGDFLAQTLQNGVNQNTAEEVANFTNIALSSVTDFTTVLDNNKITITNVDEGRCSLASSGNVNIVIGLVILGEGRKDVGVLNAISDLNSKAFLDEGKQALITIYRIFGNTISKIEEL